MEPQRLPHVWTDDELMEISDAQGKCELVDGELTVAAAGFLHDILVARLVSALEAFVRAQGLGFVAGSGPGCRMENGNLRCPDVSFVTKARTKIMGKEIVGFLKGAPDLAVEIISPSDRLYDVKKKVPEYFENGCRLCWIVDPWTKGVLVLPADGSETLLTDKDTLDGAELLPGLLIPIADLFEGLDY